MTGSGKTCYLLSMLENEYYQYFVNIFLLCPIFSFNKSYLDWKFINDPNLFVIQCDHDDVDIWLQYITNICCFDERTLIILDDVASSKDVKNRTGELARLGFSTRHNSISLCILTQLV